MTRTHRILAVDDQPANLVLVRKVLEPAGLEVREARSGAEALAVAHETAPDLILLDMHLPDMHGLDVLRRLREAAWGATLPVVAMSALASPEDRAAWEQAGCMGVIEKPILVRNFVAQISKWLSGASPANVEARDNGPQVADRFGQLLVANRMITAEQLARAAAAQPGSGKRLGQVLVDQGALSEDDLAWALSNQLGYPYVFLTPEIIDAEAVGLLSEEFLRDRRVLPIVKFGQEMTLAMADPTDQRTVDDVASQTGMTVKRALALASNISETQDHLFSRHRAERHAPTLPVAATEAQYLQFHLAQAIGQGATEIHFEPATDGQARVRYRLQGVLVDRPAQSADLHAAILRHLRTLTNAGDDPVGTAAVTLPVGEIEVVLVGAFLPTPGGEAATVTLHPVHTGAPELATLGVPGDSIRLVRGALSAVRGIVLVGCSDRWLRSTLLHGLVPVGVRGKIWALEVLPIYRRPTIGKTVLTRSADVALHIRGAADAGVDLLLLDDAAPAGALVAAHEAARTRMVLAGHPESDVVGALTQALEGAGSALVASTLRGVFVARPIRLLCPACKQPAHEGAGGVAGQRTFVPRGCENCGFTGFKGRRVLTDAWIMDADAQWLIRAKRGGEVFERLLQSGSRMREHGLALVEDGLTSIEELASIMEESPWRSPTFSS